MSKLFIFLGAYADYTTGTCISKADNLQEAIQQVVQENKKVVEEVHNHEETHRVYHRARGDAQQKVIEDIRTVLCYADKLDAFFTLERDGIHKGKKRRLEKSMVNYFKDPPCYLWSTLTPSQLLVSLKSLYGDPTHTLKTAQQIKDLVTRGAALAPFTLENHAKHTFSSNGTTTYTASDTETLEQDLAFGDYLELDLEKEKRTKFTLIQGGGS